MALRSPAVAWVVISNISGRSAMETVDRSDHRLRDIGITPVLEKLVPTAAGPRGASTVRSIFLSQLDQIVLQREQRGARPSPRADLPVKVDDVRVHRGLRDVKLARDLLVGQSPCDRPQHVDLTVRE